MGKVSQVIFLRVFVPSEQLPRYTLPEANSSHLKIDGWKTRPFLLAPQGRAVTVREGTWRIIP